MKRMENHLATVGSKGLIKRHELVRALVQSLYSLGYEKSAASLESESGIPCKAKQHSLLEEQVLDANWEACANTLNSISKLTEDKRSSAMFLILKQCLIEYLSYGDDASALVHLRKQASSTKVPKEKVRTLTHLFFCSKSVGTLTMNDPALLKMRQSLLSDLDKILPPEIVLPERRLEHLIESAIHSQIEKCLYHNTDEIASLYHDHCCSSDQIPSETIQILTEHRNEVWFVQFSNNGDFLASSSNDCTAIIWTVLEDDTATHRHTLAGHQNPVSFLAWSPDDAMLLTCGNPDVLKLWDVKTGTCKHTFGNPVSSCAWFPCSKRLVSGSVDPEKGICMWDCEGNEIRSWRRIPKVVDVAVTPDGQRLISIFSDKEIRILDIETNDERVINEDQVITSLSVSADGESFIVSLNSQEIHLWDIAAYQKSPRKYLGHKQQEFVIRSCLGGLNGSFIASGSEDSQVYIWSKRNSLPLKVLFGHKRTVNCVSWNPKRHRMLVSASDDQTIRVWGSRSPNQATPPKTQ